MSTVPTETDKLETPFCHHAQCQVAIETVMVFPIDLLPDPPRVSKRNCSHYSICNLQDKSACPEHVG
ncbi:MAG: hypothetical protein DWQ07_23780 [Chloroflexi bacterium]|nr:MAG: hypothetical protein DWQ07_23780 [Chloroflexota bacterium]MBL1194168.1 hypothetical protein [Chloroflexota bacterium]NOH11460.1 hypothetical protein [Chloroflexota bacterium]